MSARALALVAALAALASWAPGGGTAAGTVRASASEAGAFAPLGEKLLPAEEQGAGFFGRDVALSADGTTALVGAPRDSQEAGAAWVFTRVGAVWTQQAKLAAGTLEGSSFFGRGVALSADGSTALIGDPGNAANTGAAWVFTRSGATWTRQARLTGGEEIGAGQFGRDVSLSADGSTALVGAFVDDGRRGAVWAFTRSSSSWAQDGPKLTGAEEVTPSFFGRSVSLSDDGATAAIGGSRDNAQAGAAWVFTRTGSGWLQQGPKLTGGEESGAGELGSAVALSGDGSTVFAGGSGDAEDAGAAWVFVRSGGEWAQQGPKLTGAEEIGPGLLGYSVSLSDDGSSALAGAYADDGKAGAAWAFTRAGASWSQQGAKLTAFEAAGAPRFGFGVALSGDGFTALVGGIGDNSHAGAAWAFAREPPPPPPPPPPEEPSGGEGQTAPSQTPAPTTTAAGNSGVLASASVSSPVLAVTGNVEPVSGTVLVRLPHGGSFVRLSGLRQIPFGTLIDATAGRVLVTAASTGGGTQNGEFFEGEFTLTQRSNGVVTAALAGTAKSLCSAAQRRHRHAHSSAKRRRGRKLWANAHGTFATQGSYAAGAVQGTEWLTEDRCEGTLIRVTRDKVKVTDLVRHRSRIVHAGHSVLIRRP